jgi:hypothetical protein
LSSIFIFSCEVITAEKYLMDPKQIHYTRALEAAITEGLAELRVLFSAESIKQINAILPSVGSLGIKAYVKAAKNVKAAIEHTADFKAYSSSFLSLTQTPDGKNEIIFSLQLGFALTDGKMVVAIVRKNLGEVDQAYREIVTDWLTLRLPSYNIFEEYEDIIKDTFIRRIEGRHVARQQEAIDRDKSNVLRLIEQVSFAKAAIFRPIMSVVPGGRVTEESSGGSTRSSAPAYSTVSHYFAVRSEAHEKTWEMAISDHPKADDQSTGEDVRFLCLPDGVSQELFANPYPNNFVRIIPATRSENIKEYVQDHSRDIKELMKTRLTGY